MRQPIYAVIRITSAITRFKVIQGHHCEFILANNTNLHSIQFHENADYWSNYPGSSGNACF